MIVDLANVELAIIIFGTVSIIVFALRDRGL